IERLEDAVKALERGERLAGGPRVVVTFDDAYRNFYTHAWPIIQELRIPVTLYVPIDFIEGGLATVISGVELPPMTWDQIAEVAKSDLAGIGSHTMSHQDVRHLLSQDKLQKELADSRAVLEGRLHTCVDSFCYPRGFTSRRAAEVVGRFYRT